MPNAWKTLRITLPLLALALVGVPSAGAHAFLKRSDPAAGAVVATAPHEVRLTFDENVKPTDGIKVVRGGGPSVVAGAAHTAPGKGNEIVVPLRPRLGSGPYAVIWSVIDAEDGHVISGAFIFTVGSGPPIPSGTTAPAQGGNGPPLSAVISRWLLLAGLLVAAGSVMFDVLVRRAAGRALVLASGLALATLGAVLTVVLEPSSSGTDFGRRTLAGAAVAAAGTALALASLRVARLRLPAAAIAIVLLALPTATGHASASGPPHAVSVPADLVHLAAAALWIGGLVELALVARTRRDQFGTLVRRFAPFALGAVVVLGATGVVRAFTELDSVRQVWTTGYGQALLVKTGLLAAIVVLAFVNRRGLVARLVVPELVLLAVVVGAVAVLTNVRPGRDYASAATPAETQTVVYAGQDGKLAVGLSVTPVRGNGVAMRTTVLGFTGPVGGLDVAFDVDGRRASAAACGPGCYRGTVQLGGRPRAIALEIAGRGRAPATLRFAAPDNWPAPSGLDIVRGAERAISQLRTLVVHSRLGSDPEHVVTTSYRMVAPDRIAYTNDDGSGSIIIGNRRWDRESGGRWVASTQTPALRQPAPFWPPQISDASILRTDRVDGRAVWVVSFLDPGTPAWFTAWIDRENYRTLRLDMVAVAHFMHDRDGPFDEPVSIEPPAS